MVNITSDCVMAQKAEKDEAAKKAQEAKQKKFGNFEFNENHYLNTRLSKEEQEREIVIRLLPFSEQEPSPFKKVHVHSVKMTTENGEKIWKKFMCPIGMGKADKCPFCETAAEARKLKFAEKDENVRKKYNEVEFMNMSKDYWIVRCIERGHEDHGVKFWRFPDARNGEGIYDKIYALFQAKRKRGVEIFDLFEGKDLVITIKKTINGDKEKHVYQIQDDEKTRPLAETEEQMEKWVNDPMKWEDVYTIKDYDFMAIVVQGGYPVWNKSLNKWISKTDSDKINEEAKQQEIEENLKPESKDFSSFTVDTGETKTEKKLAQESKDEPKNDEDDSLPF